MHKNRNRILQSARGLIQELGFEKASCAKILKHAGISNGSFYHEFPSKDAIRDDLLLSILSGYSDGLTRQISTATARRDSLERRIHAAIGWHVDWIQADRDNARLAYLLRSAVWVIGSDGRPFPPLWQVFTEMQFAVSTPVTRLSTTSLIALLFGPVEFVSRQWLLGHSSENPNGMTASLVDGAVAGLVQTRSSKLVTKRVAEDTAQAVMEF